MTTPEEKARDEAQARRQRILEASTDRLDVVTGVVHSSSSSAADTGSGTTRSAKLAAMRRRRFKKKEADEKEPAAAKEGEKEEADDDVKAEPAPSVDAKTPAPKQPEENNDNNADEDVVEEFSTPGAEALKDVVEELSTPGAEELSAQEEAATSSPTEKKKYLGVAKMRRKMNQEKKLQEEEATTSPVKHAPLVKSKKKQIVHSLPILMHAVVVFLLFGAGLDVGLQQGVGVGSGVIVDVQTGLAPRQELRFLRLIPQSMRPALGLPDLVKEEEEDVTTPKGVLTSDSSSEYTVAEADEFGETPESKKEDEENLDPLFGLDLDKVTAGPGLLLILGRFAVKLHRVNLALFYYLPRRVVTGIYNLLIQLATLPPVLCIIALTIRQVVGNTLLGAKLPHKSTVVEDESQKKDVMNMIKNFVKGVVLKSFPTAANIYDAWTHLRSDMYVVLCGVLVGLAWTYQTSLDAAVSTSTTTTPVSDRDEL